MPIPALSRFVSLLTGFLGLPAGGVPATPPAGQVRLYGREAAGITLPAYVTPDGKVHDLQPDLVSGGALFWRVSHSATAHITLGGGIPSATGTGTAKSAGTGNAYQRRPLFENLVTVAAANAVAGFHRNSSVLLLVTVGGIADGDGGFYFVGQWGPATGVATATHRAFFGFGIASAAPTDVEPSTLVSCIGMGWDAADANVQIMHNDGSGTCTKIDLGASWPVPTADRTQIYELRMYSPPRTTQSVSYTLINLVTGAEISGTITTNLPATTQLISPRGYCSVGGTSSVVGMAIGNILVDPLL